MSSGIEVDNDGDTCSDCSSVGAPPFVLSEGGFAHRYDDYMFQSPHQSQEVMDKMYQSIRKLSVMSPAGTAETDKITQASSFFESPTRDTHGFDLTTPSCTLDDSQEIEFDAAASLLAASSLEGLISSMGSATNSFKWPRRHLPVDNISTRSLEPNLGPMVDRIRLPPRHPYSINTRSMGFSELMREAGDQQSSDEISRLPTLDSSHHYRASSVLTPRATNQSWVHQTATADHRLVQRGIQMELVGHDGFEVTMQMEATVKDVFHVLANPDLLQLWCEPIQALVVTRSSDGARSPTNRREESSSREYDGEWVEASTSSLVSPSKGGHIANAVQSLRASMGFPRWGKITMFVERRRGQMALTIGPFSGGLTAYHTMEVSHFQGITSVTDKVRICKDVETNTSSVVCCCGVVSAAQRLLEPSIDGHIDQALASITKLRLLVEHGETTSGAGVDVLEGTEIGGASMQPLLLR